MKNKSKPPISVKLICELNKDNQSRAYLVNKWGRKLDIEIEDFEVKSQLVPIKLNLLNRVTSKIVTGMEIKFTGIIQLNNKNTVKYIIKKK
ncbi:MAG: hypothetical protein Q7R95_06060 [bacterium]|nr:hypothetical protein [bacterium]